MAEEIDKPATSASFVEQLEAREIVKAKRRAELGSTSDTEAGDAPDPDVWNEFRLLNEKLDAVLHMLHAMRSDE